MAIKVGPTFGEDHSYPVPDEAATTCVLESAQSKVGSRSNRLQAAFTARSGGVAGRHPPKPVVDGMQIWRLFSRWVSVRELEKRLVQTQTKSLSFDDKAVE